MPRNRELLTLRELIEFASAQTEKLFRLQQAIYPMYHCIRTNGQNIIMRNPDPDKDTWAMMMKAWFQLNPDIDRYVFLDEAWILDRRFTDGPLDMEKIAREGLSKHPDRREVVYFFAENRRGEKLRAQRFILRPEHGKASLSPLKIDDVTHGESEGRFVGLLNTEM